MDSNGPQFFKNSYNKLMMFLFKNIVLFGASLNFEDLNVFFLTVSKIMLIMKLKKTRGFKLPLKRFVRNLSLSVNFFWWPNH